MNSSQVIWQSDNINFLYEQDLQQLDISFDRTFYHKAARHHSNPVVFLSTADLSDSLVFLETGKSCKHLSKPWL